MLDNLTKDSNRLEALSSLMRLLTDHTRLRLLGLLQHGELHVGALCDELDLPQPTVSHHLGLLRDAGLVINRRVGKQVYYRLDPDHVRPQEGAESTIIRIGEFELRLSRLLPKSARQAEIKPLHADGDARTAPPNRTESNLTDR